jgi:hypothetical protein
MDLSSLKSTNLLFFSRNVQFKTEQPSSIFRYQYTDQKYEHSKQASHLLLDGINISCTRIVPLI